MGRYNFAPQRVHQAATRLLETGARGSVAPPWYRVIGNLPPSERLVRPALQPAQRRGRKASKLFQPLKLEYEEDRLRLDFYGDHPWELARPRQVLEDDGKDYQKFDWSNLDQPGKQIDGESVVQRQAWLMGLVCHEIDFPASHALREYLRSPEFQEDFKLSLKSEHTVDLDCQVPEEGYGDLDADVTITAQLTYHPKYPHQFNEGLRTLQAELAQRGLDINAINKRSFRAAFPRSQGTTQTLQQADLSAISKQYNIDVTLEPLAVLEDLELQPMQFSFHRNATSQLPTLINHIATLLNQSPNDVLSSPLPAESPDTFNAYTKLGAYDKARKEFYEVRHFQDIERRVAREEALWTGAEFGPDPLEVGMKLEDKTYEEWREWAAQQITLAKQLSAGSGGAGDAGLADPEVDPDVNAGLDEVEVPVPGSKSG